MSTHPVPSGRDNGARLPDAVVAHRREWWEFVLAEAEPWHRHHLGRLLEVWEKINAEHFDDALVPPYLLLAEPSTPARLGQCAPVSSFGGRSEIRIRPSLLAGTHPHMRHGDEHDEGRFRFVADVLMHEMVHQHAQEVSGDTEPSYHGHGPAFAATANRIGAGLGLPPVRGMKRRGKDKDLPSCSHWPHCVRPAAWYLGAYQPVRASGDKQARAEHWWSAGTGWRITIEFGDTIDVWDLHRTLVAIAGSLEPALDDPDWSMPRTDGRVTECP